MLRRSIMRPDHDAMRESARRFFEREVAPHHRHWEQDGVAPRSVWLKAGEAGLLCATIPAEYGGAGADRLASAVLIEEQASAGLSGPGFSTHSDIVAPYILAHGTEEQRQRWLPAMARGELIGAIAMTEPDAGSDLRAIRTTARLVDGTYVVNGQKAFITNGLCADLFVVAVKTGRDLGRKSLSLIVVEAASAGFRRGPRLEKIGMKAQDTCAIYFDDAVVPAGNLLGSESDGANILRTELAWERLQIAIGAVATSRAALEWTLDHTRQRKAFGTVVADFQNTRFRLAEAKTEIQIAQVFVDRCLQEMEEGNLDATVAAMAKYWCTELMGRVVDQCLQFHGGYGYIWDYPIARAYADARVHRIYGGSNEIMRELVARAL